LIAFCFAALPIDLSLAALSITFCFAASDSDSFLAFSLSSMTFQAPDIYQNFSRIIGIF
jgi:hypothetical protein